MLSNLNFDRCFLGDDVIEGYKRRNFVLLEYKKYEWSNGEKVISSVTAQAVEYGSACYYTYLEGGYVPVERDLTYEEALLKLSELLQKQIIEIGKQCEERKISFQAKEKKEKEKIKELLFKAAEGALSFIKGLK
jgi:hypothetical protein